MKASDLRIALFSGNYNYVRDGANQSLNRLVGYALRLGAAVRVYSPTVEKPAFAPTGDLVSIPSMPFPLRGEYRFPLALSPRVKVDLATFAPNVVHVSSPDVVGHRAVTYARKRKIPLVASMHTRFESYPRYYGMGFLEAPLVYGLRRFYNRCDRVVAPSESMAQVMRGLRMGDNVGIWSRGIDRDRFNPTKRDLAWRTSLGIADQDVVIGFLGRVVMEKGLDVFADAIAMLNERGIAHKVLVVGDGPARGWFAEKLPDAVFTGFQQGDALARAVAAIDILFNPSTTETFGNVTLEAMACRMPVVGADATGTRDIVENGVSGMLVSPENVAGFADAIAAYCADPGLRKRHGLAAETAAKRYDWDLINQRMIDTYIDAIRARTS